MCVNVTKMTMYYSDGTPVSIYRTCGRCYECQTAHRGEFALRCSTEKKHSKSTQFVTLTYDNNHLVTNHSKTWQKEFFLKTRTTPKKEIVYDGFLLDRASVKNFRRRLQYSLDKLFGDHQLYRFVECGEYGDFHKRPHAHFLFFHKRYVRDDVIEKLVLQNWSNGSVDVGLCDSASINYVGKHYVKSNLGTKYQQAYAPSYLVSSVYPYGIGYQLREDSEILKLVSIGQKFIYIDKYKYSFPRYLTKYFHPEDLNDMELELLSIEGQQNFEKRFLQFSPPSDLLTTEDQFAYYLSLMRKKDFEQRQHYEKNRILRKISNKQNF